MTHVDVDRSPVRFPEGDEPGRTGPEPIVDLTVDGAPVAARRARVVRTRAVVVAAVAIVALNLLDLLTTSLVLGDGGSEANPIAALFVGFPPLFAAIKVLLPAVVAWRIWARRDRTTPMALAVMWWVVGVYSMTVVVNALHLAA